MACSRPQHAYKQPNHTRPRCSAEAPVASGQNISHSNNNEGKSHLRKAFTRLRQRSTFAAAVRSKGYLWHSKLFLALLCAAFRGVPTHSQNVSLPTCQGDYPELFLVTCGNKIYTEFGGGTAWKRCLPKQCPSYVPTPFSTVGWKTPGSSPRDGLLAFEELEIVCNASYSLRGLGSNRSQCLPDCTYLPTQRCVFTSFCPVQIDPVGTAYAKWWMGWNSPEVIEQRNASIGGSVFNEEPVNIRCNTGYKASFSDPSLGQECRRDYDLSCSTETLISASPVPSPTCVTATCPPFHPPCEGVSCGGDIGNVILRPYPDRAVDYQQNVSYSCNAGFFFPPSEYPAPGNRSGEDLWQDLIRASRIERNGTATCIETCLYDNYGTGCEPKPCPVYEIPEHATAANTTLRYWESTLVTCNFGFVQNGSSADECKHSTHVQCLLDDLGAYNDSEVGIFPVEYEQIICVRAPCQSLVIPNSKFLHESGAYNVTPESLFHDDGLTVECDLGFREAPASQDSSDCRQTQSFFLYCADCVWKPEDIVCKPVACPVIPLFPHGSFEFVPERNYVYGETITAVCDTGFRANSVYPNASVRVESVCNDMCDFPWPFCNPVLCGALDLGQPDQDLMGEGTRRGSLSLTQFADYREGSYTWAPARLVDGTVLLYFGDEVTFECPAGYRPSNTKRKSPKQNYTATCTATGDITNGDVLCIERVCDTSDIANVLPQNVSLNAVVNLTCSVGYRPSPIGTESATCDMVQWFKATCIEGILETHGYECVRIRCDTTESLPRVGEGNNGTRVVSPAGDYLLFEDEVQVRCRVGYRINSHNVSADSSAAAVCQSDCELDQPLECLPVACSTSTIAPTNAKNVSIAASEFYYGETLRIQCNQGYIFSTSSAETASTACLPAYAITCGADSSPRMPGECIPACEERLDANAVNSPAGTRVAGGQNVNYTCNTGYRATDSGTSSTCADYWTYDVMCSYDCGYARENFQCQPVECEVSPLRANAFVATNASSILYQEELFIECEVGYRLVSSPSNAVASAINSGTVTCTERCNTTESCQPVLCPLNQVPDNAHQATGGSGIQFLNTVSIKCNAGFVLQSNTSTNEYVATCTSDGSLSPAEVCTPVVCPAIEDEYALFSPAGDLGFNQTLTALCQTGTFASDGTGIPEGSRVGTCANPAFYTGVCETFRLNIPDVECTPIQCNATWLTLNVGGNGSTDIPDGLVSYGTNIAATCAPGYRFAGTLGVSAVSVPCDCRFSETSSNLFCEPITCNASDVPTGNATVTSGSVADEVAYGTVIEVLCNEGYVTASGPQSSAGYVKNFSMSCGDTGILTNSDEECVLAMCRSDDVNVETHSPGNPVRHGVTLNATCKSGHKVALPGMTVSCDLPSSYAADCSYFQLNTNLSCEPITCDVDDMVASVEHAVSEETRERVDLNETVEYACDRGFSLGGVVPEGSFTVTCVCPPELSTEDQCEGLTCDSSFVPTANASIVSGAIGDEVIWRSNISIQCEEGFVISSGGMAADEYDIAFTMHCTDDGVLTNSNVSCVLSTCSPNDDPNIAFQSPSGTVAHGVVVTSTCNEGYRSTLAGVTADCSHNTSYLQTCSYFELLGNFSCTQVMCNVADLEAELGQASAVSGGLSSTVTYGTDVLVGCNQGYSLGGVPYGTAVVTCGCPTPSVDTTDVCELLTCDSSFLPPSDAQVVNTTFNASRVEYRTTLMVACNDGYVAESGGMMADEYDVAFTMHCTDDGVLTNSNVSCVLSTCSPNDDPNIAFQSPSGTVDHGVVVTSTCNEGYRSALAGVTADCSHSTSYLQTCSYFELLGNFSCTQVMCNVADLEAELGQASAVSGGLSSTVTYGTDVLVGCNQGYSLGGVPYGTAVVTCGCPTPSVNTTDVCELLTCDSSFLPPNNAYARLREDGRFLPPMEGIGSTVLYGTRIYVHCEFGFILASGGQSMANFRTNYTMTCNDFGQLTNQSETCIRSTCRNEDPNSTPGPLNSTFMHGDNTTVTCNFGFRAADAESASVACSLPGSYEAQCQMFELRADVSCRSVTCNTSWLEERIGGDFGFVVPSNEQISFGSTVVAQCDEGYRFRGTVASAYAEITCDCDFETNDFVCEPITCNATTLPPANSFITSGEVGAVVEFGGVVKLQCAEGYVVASGPRTAASYQTNFSMSCGSSGVLSGLDETCVLATCSNADVNAAFEDPSAPVDYDITTNVTCSVGHKAFPFDAGGYPSCGLPSSYTALCGYFELHSDLACQTIECNTTEIAIEYNSVPPATPTVLYGQNTTLRCLPGYGIGQSSSGELSVTCGCPPYTDARALCEPLPACNPADTVFSNGAPVFAPSAEFLYEDSLTVTCNEGYRFSGNDRCEVNFTAICGFETIFETPAGTVDCSLVTCQVSDVELSLATIDEPVAEIGYGQSVTYRCNPGHRVDSHDPTAMQTAALECRQDCSIDAAPTCLPVKCNASHLVSDSSYVFGDVDADNLMLFNTSGLLVCRDGFWLDGSTAQECRTNTTLSCTQSGVLEGLAGSAVCVPVVCGVFVAPNASDPSPLDDTAFLSEKSVTCNAGYRPTALPTPPTCDLDQEFAVTCSTCGRYMEPATTCQRVACNISELTAYYAANPEYGTISTSSTLFGQQVKVQCNEGFLLLSQHLEDFATCQQDCMLDVSPEYLKCRPVDCVFPIPSNITFEGIDFPDAPEYSMEFEEQWVGVCDEGLVINHAECTWKFNVTCLGSGIADGSNQTCVSSVCEPYTDPNSQTVLPTGSISYPNAVNVTCLPGYRATGSDNGVCSNSNFYLVSCGFQERCKMDAPEQTCQLVQCGTDFENGFVGPADSNGSFAAYFNDTFDVTCYTGYRINSHDIDAPQTSRATCDDDCGFTPDTECLPVGCDASGLLASLGANSELILDDFNFTDTVYYGTPLRGRCIEGYRFADNPPGVCDATFEFECRADGTIRPTRNDTTCTPIVCDLALLQGAHWSSTITNASDLESVPHGTSVSVQCVDGYRINSNDPSSARSAVVACTDSCTFSPQETFCQPVKCDAADYFAENQMFVESSNGSQITQFSYGDTANISCRPGYMLDGQEERACVQSFSGSCADDGSFTSESCVQLVCPANSYDGPLFFGQSRMVFGERLAFQLCPPGYYAGPIGLDIQTRCNIKVITLLCTDGCQVVSPDNEACIPISCGQFGRDSFLDENYDFPFGNNSIGSWSPTRSMFYEETLDVTCGPGYRVSEIDLEENYTSCTDPRTFEAECSDQPGDNSCLFNSNGFACTLVQCEPLETETMFSDALVVHGTAVDATCKDGYRAAPNGHGDAPVTCDMSSTLSITCNDCDYDAEGTCEKVMCDMSVVQARAGVESTSPPDWTTWGENATVTCSPGYRPPGFGLEDPRQRSYGCNRDCTIREGEYCIPICSVQLATLPRAPRPNSAWVTSYIDPSTGEPADWTPRPLCFGEAITVRCPPGFRRAKSDANPECEIEWQMTVDADGALVGTGADERCVPSQCSIPIVENGVADDSIALVDYDGHVAVTCNEGYRASARVFSTPDGNESSANLSGPVLSCSASRVYTMNCSSDCTFDPGAFSCQRCQAEPCTAFSPPANSNFFPSDAGGNESEVVLLAGDSQTLQCKPGFATNSSSGGDSPSQFFDAFCLDTGRVIGLETCVCPANARALTQTTFVDGMEVDVEFCVCLEGFYGFVTLVGGVNEPLECEQCPVGSSSPEASPLLSECKCIPGYYGGGGDDCTECPAYTFSEYNRPNLEDCTCVAGSYRDPADTLCRICPSFSDSIPEDPTVPGYTPGKANCICNEGYRGRGDVNCSLCLEGTIWYQDSELVSICECQANWYGVDAQCKRCPPNSTSPERSTIIQDCACDVGFFVQLEPSYFCERCPENSLSTIGGIGVGSCSCLSNYYLQETADGGGHCIQCPVDFVSPQGSTSLDDCVCKPNSYRVGDICESCPDFSTYTEDRCVCDDGYLDVVDSVTGRQLCEECPPNAFFRSGQCVPCHENSISAAASRNLSACLCRPGYSEPEWCSPTQCTPCQECEIGTYKDLPGNYECFECPVHSTTFGTGASSIEECICAPGYGRSANRTRDGLCSLCEAGTFSTTGDCTPCVANSVSAIGAVTCDCLEGFTGPDCQPCAVGTYKPTRGSAACSACPMNSTSDPGQGFCFCEAGNEGDFTNCQGCERGKFKTTAGDEACRDCPVHKTGPTGSTTEDLCECTYGWFLSNVTGVCEACEPTTYKPTIGPDACSQCPEGSTSEWSSRSSDQCLCPPGRWWDARNMRCLPCPVNTYKDMMANTQCTPCPPNSQASNTSGQDEASDCKCDIGYAKQSDGVCVQCPTGTFKNTSGDGACLPCATSICPPGLYRSQCQATADALCTEECSNAPASSVYTSGGNPFDRDFCEFELVCDETKTVPRYVDGLVVSCLCGPGYTGALDCVKCEAGKYKSNVGEAPCAACQPNEYALEGFAECAPCPTHSSSRWQTPSISGCTCNTGYDRIETPNENPNITEVSLTCESCRPGTYGVAEGCLSCPSGQVSTQPASTGCLGCAENMEPNMDQSECTCSPGFFGEEECQPCEANTFKYEIGRQECSPCPANSVSGYGAAACRCNDGYYTENPNDVECLPCAAGTFSFAGSTRCTDCEAGTYQDQTGESSCRQCPVNATSSPGASMLSDCTCNAGFAKLGDNPPAEMFCGRICPPLDPATASTLNGVLALEEGVEYHYTQMVGLQCSEGFSLFPLDICSTENIQVKCRKDGTWGVQVQGDCSEGSPLDWCPELGRTQEPQGRCQPSVCMFEPAPNALPAAKLVDFDAEVNISCAPGYNMSSPTRQVVSACQWDCSMTSVDYSCDPVPCYEYPATVPNVEPSPSFARQAVFPESLLLTCARGFIARRSGCEKVIRPQCQEDRLFSDQEDPCKPATCQPISEYMEGVLVDLTTQQVLNFGDEVEIRCKPGWVPSASCSTRNGAEYFGVRCGVSDDTADACEVEFNGCQCVKVECGVLPAPANSIVLYPPESQGADTIFLFGDTATVQCNDGFRAAGSTSCSRSYEAYCDETGTLVSPGCEPVVCEHMYTVEKQNLRLSNGQVSVTFGSGGETGTTALGRSVATSCNYGFDPAVDADGFSLPNRTIALCRGDCQLVGVAVCEPWLCSPYVPLSTDFVLIPQQPQQGQARFGDGFAVSCQEGYRLENSILLPGLESLGGVMIVAHVQFPVPTATEDAVLSLDSLSVTADIPAGAWPPGVTEPPSITMFEFPSRRRGGPGAVVAGPALSFGPAGVRFLKPVVLTLPFDNSNQDFANMDIVGCRYNMTGGNWIPVPYPSFVSNPVDRRAGTVQILVTMFEPPYAASAVPIVIPNTTTPAPIAPPPPPPVREVPPEESTDWLFLITVCVGTFLAVLLCAGLYMAVFQTNFLKSKFSRKPAAAAEDEAVEGDVVSPPKMEANGATTNGQSKTGAAVDVVFHTPAAAADETNGDAHLNGNGAANGNGNGNAI